jgi:hydroxyacylglutathione hydrolase
VRLTEHASVAKLAALRIDALFPGHHEISLARAGRHLDTANATMTRGLLPESTV